MQYKVRALSIDLTVEPHRFSAARDEIIDTASNPIFTGCETIRDVEIAYEGYWNYLNGDDRLQNASAKVKGLSVLPAPS